MVHYKTEFVLFRCVCVFFWWWFLVERSLEINPKKVDLITESALFAKIRESIFHEYCISGKKRSAMEHTKTSSIEIRSYSRVN